MVNMPYFSSAPAAFVLYYINFSIVLGRVFASSVSLHSTSTSHPLCFLFLLSSSIEHFVHRAQQPFHQNQASYHWSGVEALIGVILVIPMLIVGLISIRQGKRARREDVELREVVRGAEHVEKQR